MHNSCVCPGTTRSPITIGFAVRIFTGSLPMACGSPSTPKPLPYAAPPRASAVSAVRTAAALPLRVRPLCRLCALRLRATGPGGAARACRLARPRLRRVESVARTSPRLPRMYTMLDVPT